MDGSGGGGAIHAMSPVLFSIIRTCGLERVRERSSVYKLCARVVGGSGGRVYR